MLPKLFLVVYLLTGRSEIQVQYVVKMQSEAACLTEASKYKHSGFQAYPIQYAVCTFDASMK